MLKYCFRSANDFLSLGPLDISVTESLFDVSNLRLELKRYLLMICQKTMHE
jgi:hypothetical protein